MPQSIDKRILKSRRALLRAMPSLLRDKPIEKITVREIAEAAGINRKTFYAHYASPADLYTDLADKVTDAIIKRMPGHTASMLSDFTNAVACMAEDFREEFELFVCGEHLLDLRHMVFVRLCDILAPQLFSEEKHAKLMAASMIGSTLALYAAYFALEAPPAKADFQELHDRCLAQGLA